MKTPHHVDAEGALSIQNFRDAPTAADDGLEVTPGQAALLQPDLDGLDGIGRVDGPALRLICLDQGDENVQPITLGRTMIGFHQVFDLRQGASVIAFGTDRCDGDRHGALQMELASIASYAACVPTKRTYTTRYG